MTLYKQQNTASTPTRQKIFFVKNINCQTHFTEDFRITTLIRKLHNNNIDKKITG